MKRALLLCGLVWTLLVAGCGRSEPAPSTTPEQDEAMMWREKYFGPQIAAAKDIAWRKSGLGIRLIKPGEGASPQMMDRVLVHYVGRLKDGTVFDDSHPRGKPSEFVVNQLITGWAASMSSLKPGGRAEFFIPPHLGYGGLRAGNIPPYSGLIFDVELIMLNPPAPEKP